MHCTMKKFTYGSHLYGKRSIVFVTMTLLHSWKNIEAKALKYLRVGLGEQLLPS